MKWVMWRQYRLEIIINLIVLIVLAALFIPLGIARLSRFHALGLANLSPTATNYATLSSEFWGAYPWATVVTTLINFLPAIIGALFAVPFIYEFEQRTYRLAWTQSIPRGRWLAVKLGFAVAATVVLSGLVALLMSWFLYPDNQLNGTFYNFSLQGVVPVAYAVFTLAVTIAVGILSRRAAPAVLASLVVAIVAVTFVGSGFRLHYITPLQQTSPVSYSAQGIPQVTGNPKDTPIPHTAWTVDEYFVDASGQRLQGISLQDGHINVQYGSKSSTSDIAGLVVEYQPADRYWPFQGIEAAIFLGAAIIPLGITGWVIKRRFR